MIFSLHSLRHRLALEWGARSVVLLYHRIAEPETDPWNLAVTPAHFAEHMTVLRQRTALVPLRALPESALQRATRRGVAVTFDDGYADNFHAALPALENGDIPATFFIITGAIGGDRFWWDRLAELVLLPGTLPEHLVLHVGDRDYEWHLGDSARYDEDSFARNRAWRASAPSPGPRQTLFLELWRLVRALPTGEQSTVIESFAACVTHDATDGVTHGATRTAPGRPMTVAELASMAVHPLVEMGGHTVSHPRLTDLSAAEQQREIAGGRSQLGSIIGRPVTSFSYPFGSAGDFNSDSVTAVQRAGFERACANYAGRVSARTDPYRMPRIYVRDSDGSTFERQLATWL